MNNDLIDVKKLRPFTRFCMTIGELPTSYLETMSYYEMLLWFTKFLGETVIPAINNNGEAVSELQNLYVELKNYVDNYFDNLDVQEEINNKLDEMVENGELAEIIQTTVFKNLTYENFKVLFPKSQGLIKSGDCILLKVNNKSILIDTHRSDCKDGIEEFLTDNGITTLDYVILTHYHDDHVGNFVNLVTDGFITSNTHVYLPGYSSLIEQSESTLGYYTAVNTAILNNNIPHEIPDELDTLIIDDFKLTFYNCEQTIFTTFNYTDYNDCSTVCLVEYGNNKLLFSGDIGEKVFKRFNDYHLINEKINLYKIAHHGINYNDPNAITFLETITPDITVQTCELLDVTTNVVSQGGETGVLKHLGTKMYAIYNNSNDIIFNVSYYDISNYSGISNYTMSNRPVEITLYVDSETDNIYQLGTEENPFKDLSECCSKLLNISNTRYIINLADGDYNDGVTNNYQSKICGNIEVTINGNSNDNTAVNIKNGIQIFNGVNLTINNCSLNTNATLYISNSYLTMNNCIVDGDESGTFTKTLIYSTKSTLNIHDTTLENANIGISGHNDIIYSTNNTFNTLTTALQNSYGRIQLNGNTYTGVTNKNLLSNNCINDSNNSLYRKLIYSGDVNSGDITLDEDIRKYKMVLMTFGAVSTGQLCSGIAVPYKNDGFNVNSSYLVPFMSTSTGTTVPSLCKFKVLSGGTSLTIEKCDNQHLRCIWGINIETNNE